jgi:ribonuclease HI
LVQIQRHTIEWQWVRGHDGNPGNERADQLAEMAGWQSGKIHG